MPIGVLQQPLIYKVLLEPKPALGWNDWVCITHMQSGWCLYSKHWYSVQYKLVQIHFESLKYCNEKKKKLSQSLSCTVSLTTLVLFLTSVAALWYLRWDAVPTPGLSLETFTLLLFFYMPASHTLFLCGYTLASQVPKASFSSPAERSELVQQKGMVFWNARNLMFQAGALNHRNSSLLKNAHSLYMDISSQRLLTNKELTRLGWRTEQGTCPSSKI